VRDAGVATAVAANALVGPARAGRRRRPSVVVLGGGVAGLTAAHELAERGFDVTVYERKALGGKARSMPVPASASNGRRPLPAEHGYRICIGTYQYLPETMARIPLPRGGGSVHDNLVTSHDFLAARSGGREDFHLFVIGPPAAAQLTADKVVPELIGLLQSGESLPPDEATLFARRLAIYLTSSEARRFGQWEQLSMWDYMQAEGKSDIYQRLFADGLSHFIQSTPAKLASARAHMNLWEAVVYSLAGQGEERRPFAKLLNAPTNEAWIDPWIVHQRRLGVRFRVGHTIEALRLHRGRIAAARVRSRRGQRSWAHADWFVCALPVERARRLLSGPILRADPGLERLRDIETRWMNGIQFYLRRRVDINPGHVAYGDSPWKLSSVSQAQFWGQRDFARDYGDGEVRDCLSVIASEWQEPGILFGKPARDCTRDEIAREVWAQIKAHLEDTGRSYLPDDLLHSWFLDPAIRDHTMPGGPRSDEPLFIETPGLWDHRPDTRTAIANLFLAADYVRNRSPLDAATMDGANAAARAAVNAVLETAGSRATPVPMYERHTAPEFVEAKRIDARRYKAGEPHLLDGG
jgi:uncharacterized protein with NAD-binding domain and iron-sulfur cluster